MEYGQTFATLERMDEDGKTIARRENSGIVRKLEHIFDTARERVRHNSQDIAKRTVDFLQMASVVKKLYERAYNESALLFYRQMKTVFSYGEMSVLYSI